MSTTDADWRDPVWAKMPNKTTEPAALAGIEPVAYVVYAIGRPPHFVPVINGRIAFKVDGYTPLYSAATVEQLIRERDEAIGANILNRNALKWKEEQLAAMTQERDDLLQARAICPECAKKIDEAAGIDLVGLNKRLAACQQEKDDYRAALELIADTDPDDGTQWFHYTASEALAKYPHEDAIEQARRLV